MDKHGNWMHIALVENTEDYIHHEHRCDDQKRQRLKELLEDQTLTLQLASYRWRQYLRGRFLDVLNHIAERHIGFSIEPEGHARELIEVIDRLQSEVLLRFRDSANRDHAYCRCPVSRKLREDLAGWCAPDRRPRR